MDLKPATAFGDDRPKQNPWLHDALGFAPFAQGISRVIISLSAPNGYVIGVHGQWGSGKSTVINFVLEYIAKHNAENEGAQVKHIDFRPWIVSAHQDLIAAFFKVLSEKIGPKDSVYKRVTRRGMRLLDDSTDKLIDAAATMALMVDASGTAGAIAGSVAKKSLKTMIKPFLEDPSLQRAYSDLRQQLAASKRKFFVTIDDIDRLERAEVKAIMQLVKSIGQLPNVIYLLAYDREIVSAALDANRDGLSPRFAEKIVQHELELPKPPRHMLLSMLDRENKGFLAEGDPSLRWHYIVRDGVHRWIRSPRDVVRLSNALKFSWPALQGEIDAQDVFAMEGLRLFDPGVFYWIREYRDLFFSDGAFSLASDAVKEAAVLSLKERISKNAQPHVLHLLAILFPQAAKLFQGKDAFGQESNQEILRRRGIATEAGYDAYFGLHPSIDAVPRTVVREILARSDDAGFVEASIRSYIGKENTRGQLLINMLLEDLRVITAASPSPPKRSFLEALISVGLDIIAIERDPNLFELPARAQWQYLTRTVLERSDDVPADELLISACEAGAAAVLADVYVDRGRELSVFPSAGMPDRPVISNEAFVSFGEILREKLSSEDRDGTLKRAPFFFDIARAWSHLESPERVRDWLSLNLTEDAEFMRKVGLGLLTYSTGSSGKSYSFRERPEAPYYDLAAILKAGKAHLETELTKDQRAVIAELVRGAEKILRASADADQELKE